MVSKINIPNITTSCHQAKSIEPDDIVLKYVLKENLKRGGEIKSGLDGLEPATPCVTGMYSNQLNYQTKVLFFIAIPLNCGAKIGGFFELAIV